MTSKLRFLFDVYLQANGVWQFKQFCGSLVQMMCGRRGARLDVMRASKSNLGRLVDNLYAVYMLLVPKTRMCRRRS